MFSVQSFLLHSLKLERSKNLINLFSDSSNGAISNVSLPILGAQISISDSNYSEHSKSIFIPIGLSSQSNFFRSPFHSNTCKCLNIIQSLRCLALFSKSRNELASIDYDRITYQKVQYPPPSYNSNVIFEFPLSHVFASTSKITLDGMDNWFEGLTWCCTITFNVHNNLGFTFRKSLCSSQLLCNNQRMHIS